jgi:hypothetical protein
MNNALVRHGIWGIAALVLGALSLGSILMAEDTGPSEASRAVRLSNVEGEVHLSQGNTPLADQAVANTPLFEGTTITTGNDGRAEIQFEDGSVARVSPQSSLTLALLRGAGTGDRDAELQLNGGLGYFELQGDSDSSRIQIRFGETVVTAGGFAVIRINLDKAPGEVAVFSGNVHLEGGATPAIDLHGGESVALNASDPGSYNLSESIEPDSWDTWNSDRDQALTTASAGRTAATNNEPDNNNPAWSDLDANGNWYNVPDQGYVWSPNEAATPGWDPYGNGYWMSTPSYGYTWISGYPWGYLPYQCGGWSYYNSFGWGWAPGTCNPWWGGGGVYVINIVVAPHGYRYPVRPHPYNPRPMVAGRATPAPLVVVDRRSLAGNVYPAPRDRSGSVMIAGNIVHPLKPIQPTRAPYNSFAPGSPAPNPPASSYYGRSGMQNGPRPIAVPAHPGTPYSPAAPPRPSGSIYSPAAPPRLSGSTYTPAPVYHPAPPVHSAPPSPPPASHPAPPSGGGGGGGAHPSGGGPHR